MAYGLKYRADYDTLGINPDSCRIEIYEKNYTGVVYPLQLSANPVVQTYETDEPFAAIKGCSLTLALHNNGSLPLTSFYAPEDDQFKVIHYLNSQPTFEGFIVQDDCTEDLLDYRHEIVLSANDNLGLLKSVAFNNQTFTTYRIYDTPTITRGAPNGLIFSDYAYVPEVGVQFEIKGTSFDGIYTPTAILPGSGFVTVTVAESVTTGSGVPAILVVSETFDFYKTNNLLSIIQGCLLNTGLELNTAIFANIFEQSHRTTNSFLQQTFIDTQTFLDDNSFKNCWDVLIYILERFSLTLFQQDGRWVIVRLRELRYGAVNGFVYDFYFNKTGTDTFGGAPIQIGFNQVVYPVSTPQKSIVRPVQYSKETFNYVQPKYLLKNYDLLKLGALLNTYVVGSGANAITIKEYEFPEWELGVFAPLSQKFIRIRFDAVGNELDRIAVVKSGSPATAQAVISSPIEVNEGDKFRFSVDFKTNNSQAGSINLVFVVRLTDGTTTQFLRDTASGTWFNSPGWTYNIASGDNTNNWHTLTMSNNDGIPFDGLLTISINQVVGPSMNASPNDETLYRNFSFEYTPYINDSTKIIGQTHTNSQSLNIKNNIEQTVFMDDSPRSPVKGTLFTMAYEGLLRVRTSRWFRAANDTERIRLGELTTFEELYNNREPRAKIEGDFVNVSNIGMLSEISYSPFNIQMVFGRLEIKYRQNQFSASMYEVANGGNDSDIANTYVFDYIYSAR